MINIKIIDYKTNNALTIIKCIEDSLLIALKNNDIKKYDWLVDKWIEIVTYLKGGE